MSIEWKEKEQWKSHVVGGKKVWESSTSLGTLKQNFTNTNRFLQRTRRRNGRKLIFWVHLKCLSAWKSSFLLGSSKRY